MWADYVVTPYLIHEELYDHFLLSKRSVQGPVLLWPGRAFAAAEALRSALAQQLAPRKAFAAACYGHCLAEDEGFWSVKAGGSGFFLLASSLQKAGCQWYPYVFTEVSWRRWTV